MKNKIINLILRWTWELPQTLLGLCLIPFYKKTLLRVIDYDGTKVYLYDKFPGGISLGYYTHLDWNAKDHNNNIVRIGLKRSIKHESAGHGKQSRYLGPLYLIIIGLPSIIHCWIHELCGRKWDYYSFPTEKWADKLGCVER